MLRELRFFMKNKEEIEIDLMAFMEVLKCKSIAICILYVLTVFTR